MMWPGAVLALALGWPLGTALERAAAWLVATYVAGEGTRPGRPYLAPNQPVLPAVSAVTMAALWLHYGATLELVLAIAAAIVLVLVAAIDVDRRLVPNELLLIGCLPALLRAAGRGLPGLWFAVLGATLAFGFFLLAALIGRGALGMGDVKLAGLMGLTLAYPIVLRSLFLAVLAGGLTAAVLLLTHRVARTSKLPYAPFLALGGIVGLLL